MRIGHSIRWLLGASLLAGAFAGYRACTREGATGSAALAATEDAISIWVMYDGTLDSREVRNINSDLAGGATLVELAPDGARVKAGDVLVRFDASNYERDLVKAEREYSNAGEELAQIVHAKQPLEINDLEMNLLEARAGLDAEEQYLRDTRELAGESLVAGAEVAQQEQKVPRFAPGVEPRAESTSRATSSIHPRSSRREAPCSRRNASWRSRDASFRTASSSRRRTGSSFTSRSLSAGNSVPSRSATRFTGARFSWRCRT